MTDFRITTPDGGSFTAFAAFPAQSPAPAVIVIQEIFGVNAELRRKCADLAGQGYVAVCPDLFWRIESGVSLTDGSEAEWQKAFGLFQAFDVDQGVEDLRAVMHAVRAHPACNGKVGAVGYCLGGKLAYLMAARVQPDCAVGYYGVGLGALMAESDGITTPLMIHIAEDDEYVPPAEQEAVRAALKDHPHVAVHSYPQAPHAFARDGGINYRKEAADLANTRTAAFLSRHLQS